MTDREVVITHLDDLRLFADVTVHPVVSPDNWDVYSGLCDYIDQIKTEVEILLKEQEAVEPIKMQRMDNNFSFFVPYFLCGNCRYELVGENVLFCAHCGRKVKWND